MYSPIEKFIERFNSLPEDHKMDIAYLIGLVIPFISTSELKADSERIDEKFVAIIQSASENPIKEVGVVYFLKPAIQQLIIDRHASDSSGRKKERALLELFEKTGSVVFADQAAQAQFKAKQWSATGEKMEQSS